MYLHFDTESLQITGVSPVLRESETVRAFPIEREFGRQLITGEERLTDYIIFKEGEEFVLDKIAQAVVSFNQHLKALALTEIVPTKDLAECEIIYNQTSHQLTVRFKKLMNNDVHRFAAHALSDEQVPVYITKKNDPTYLLQVVNLVVQDIVSVYNGEYTVTTRQLPEEVSFYTRQFFNSYSLEYT